MIIDASNLILGRMASYVAKKALLGNKIDIVNCEKSIVIGKRKEILAKYHKRMQMGVHSKGPFIPKMPDRFVKRTIRGMLPYKTTKGSSVFKKIICHIGIPDKFKDEKIEMIKNEKILNSDSIDFVKVNDLCRSLGGKI
jgi:large subunit ribosomal protein L13